MYLQAPTGEKYYFPWANWIGQQCPMVEIPASLMDPTQGRKVYKVRDSDSGDACGDAPAQQAMLSTLQMLAHGQHMVSMTMGCVIVEI